MFEALRAGAVGYLLKDVSGARLNEAVRAAARGESFLAPVVATRPDRDEQRLNDLRRHAPSRRRFLEVKEGRLLDESEVAIEMKPLKP